MEILNASFYEQRLPSMWKTADVTPLPKKKRVKLLEKDLRPISLTPAVSEMAEGFIVDDYAKPAVLKVLDHSQYGAIPNSFTTMALISMLHHWSLGTDGNGSTVRTLLFDYRKAFDLIDHSIVITKLSQLDIPRTVVNWVSDFLSDRSQRIKLKEGCFSEWGSVPSGVPQGTKLGPWLFVLMINDLDISSPHLWKFVDHTTASEFVLKGGASNAQCIADRVSQWSHDNRAHLNADKCKELRISFAKELTDFDPVIVGGKELEVVDSVKLLGVTISSSLSWNLHIDEVIKKAKQASVFSG